MQPRARGPNSFAQSKSASLQAVVLVATHEERAEHPLQDLWTAAKLGAWRSGFGWMRCCFVAMPSGLASPMRRFAMAGPSWLATRTLDASDTSDAFREATQTSRPPPSAPRAAAAPAGPFRRTRRKPRPPRRARRRVFDCTLNWVRLDPSPAECDGKRDPQ